MIRSAPRRGRNPAMAWDPVPTPVLGEHEKALAALEPSLKVPYFLSPGWLAIELNFEPLNGNARFERPVHAAPFVESSHAGGREWREQRHAAVHRIGYHPPADGTHAPTPPKWN